MIFRPVVTRTPAPLAGPFSCIVPNGHYASETLPVRSRYALAADEGGPDLLLGQAGVSAKLLDGNQGAAELAELHPDALQETFAGLVTDVTQ